MKKLNGVVVILMLLAVFMILTDLVLTVFPLHSLAMGGILELYFIVVSLLIIGIACCSILYEDLNENKIWIAGWLAVDVLLWLLSFLFLKVVYRF